MTENTRIVTLPLLRSEALLVWRAVSDLAATEPNIPTSRTAQSILEMLARPLGKPLQQSAPVCETGGSPVAER